MAGPGRPKMVRGGTTYAEVGEPQLLAMGSMPFREFAEHHLKIRTKEHGLRPLKLNRSQLMREGMFLELEKRGLPLRIWEAKARQLGASTHIQARGFWKCVTNRDTTFVIAAHERVPASEIFDKAKTFYDHLGEGLKPLTKYNNVQLLDFRAASGPTGLRSKLAVVVAESEDSLRSFSAQLAHFSEVAFYSRPDAFFKASMQSLAKGPGTMVYGESTCNGSGDFHHEKYLSSRVLWPDPPPWMELKQRHPGNPDSDFWALFTPWFVMDEYQAPLRLPESDFIASLDNEERLLLEKFAGWVTLNHLQWRRTSIQNNCGGHVAVFREEYPATDEEAFNSSGTPVFAVEDVKWTDRTNACWCEACLPYAGAEKPTENSCPPHQWAEVVDSTGGVGSERVWSTRMPTMEARAPHDGRLSIWEQPQKGARYVVGVDVAAGPSSRDWDVASVWDVSGPRQVAEWRGKVEITDLAEVCLLIAMLWNNAVLAPERNGVGAGLIPLLERTRYYNIYRQHSLHQSGVFNTSLLGWLTSSQTKPAMVSLTQQGVTNRHTIIRSRGMTEEMRAYQRTVVYGKELNEAKMSAPAGKNDDALMAGMISVAVCHYQPGFRAASVDEAAASDMRRARALDPTTWTEADWVAYRRANANLTRSMRRR